MCSRSSQPTYVESDSARNYKNGGRGVRPGRKPLIAIEQAKELKDSGMGVSSIGPGEAYVALPLTAFPMV